MALNSVDALTPQFASERGAPLNLQEGTPELPATFVGNKTIDGKTLGVVRVTLSNADAIDCYVDPQTEAYRVARPAKDVDDGVGFEPAADLESKALASK